MHTSKKKKKNCALIILPDDKTIKSTLTNRSTHYIFQLKTPAKRSMNKSADIPKTTYSIYMDFEWTKRLYMTWAVLPSISNKNLTKNSCKSKPSIKRMDRRCYGCYWLHFPAWHFPLFDWFDRLAHTAHILPLQMHKIVKSTSNNVAFNELSYYKINYNLFWSPHECV